MANSQASVLCTLCLAFLRLLNGNETVHWTVLTYHDHARTMTYMPLLVLWGTLQDLDTTLTLSSSYPSDFGVVAAPATVGFLYASVKLQLRNSSMQSPDMLVLLVQLLQVVLALAYQASFLLLITYFSAKYFFSSPRECVGALFTFLNACTLRTGEASYRPVQQTAERLLSFRRLRLRVQLAQVCGNVFSGRFG